MSQKSNKEKILDVLFQSNTGLTLQQIADRTGLNTENIRKQLHPFRKSGTVKTATVAKGRKTHFFYVDPEVRRIQEKIKEVLERSSGLSIRELSARLDMEQEALSLHLNRLQKDGLVVECENDPILYALSSQVKQPSSLHPTQVRIVSELEKSSWLSVRELEENIGESKFAIYHHLDQLQKMQEVVSTGSGSKSDPRLYSLSSKANDEIPASQVQKKILDVLERTSNLTIGVLQEKIGVGRYAIDKNLRPLVQDGIVVFSEESLGYCLASKVKKTFPLNPAQKRSLKTHLAQNPDLSLQQLSKVTGLSYNAIQQFLILLELYKTYKAGLMWVREDQMKQYSTQSMVELHRTGLVKRETRNQYIYYALSPSGLHQL
ncbi:winged helix-turn-helix transcriptional regulator [Shimazuella kribbensis]|uniref:winged helix-turn-helix transcriptional regulator n=1 Tax=Shimazuella kribbensis TaxID=139808 RepID=UPI0003FA7BBF|nr:winged helix-turn-helix transcriptional regulator [Shimazuella kribbensis]